MNNQDDWNPIDKLNFPETGEEWPEVEIEPETDKGVSFEDLPQ